MDKQCDLSLPGIYISNGYVNDYIPATLISEGVLVQQHRWEFQTTHLGKLAKHPQGEFWAQQQGTLFYLPDAMVGINGNETADISAAGMDDTHVVQDTRTKAVGEHQK